MYFNELAIGMKTAIPSTVIEKEEMLDFAVNHWDGPIAVRYPRGTAERNADHFAQMIKTLYKEAKM